MLLYNQELCAMNVGVLCCCDFRLYWHVSVWFIANLSSLGGFGLPVGYKLHL